MTFGAIYAEIVKRAGEGYDAYLDRAAEMFWKAVSGIIQSGEYDEKEIRKLDHRNSVSLSKSSFTNNKYSLAAWFGANSGPFRDYKIFDYKVVLAPTAPENCRFVEVGINELRQKNSLNLLNAATGIPEVIWAFSYPEILITADTQDFTCVLSVATHAIARAAITNADGTFNEGTNSDDYFSYGFLVRAIELATQYLKTETE